MQPRIIILHTLPFRRLYIYSGAGIVQVLLLIRVSCLPHRVSDVWKTRSSSITPRLDSPAVGVVLCRMRYSFLHMARRELLPDWQMVTLSIDHGRDILERYIQNQESLNAETLCTGSVLKSEV